VAEYVCPDVIKNDSVAFSWWKESIQQTHDRYCTLVTKLSVDLLGNCPNCDDDNPTIVGAKVICNKCQQVRLISTEQRKAARQAARSVLPNATETKIFASANVRAIRHFIELRASRHAEPEIRKVANRIWAIMKQEAPSLFGDYTMSPLPDGTYEVVTLYRKV
jgi:thymidylate synthase (FAD)